jgi:mannose-6-phosphate isomerase-like protein (cupin superfamily)
MKRSVTFGAGVVSGLLLAGVVWLGSAAVSSNVLAQSGAAAGQKNTSKIVLENARVRVKEAVFYPGDKNPGPHTHDLAHVGVIIEGGSMLFKSPDGKTETMKLTAGGVGYRDANVTHEPINTGTAPVRVIEVELK